jgi:transposase, IS5 family
MKNINPIGLFDTHFQLEELTKLKDPLVKLNSYVSWKIFTPVLEAAFLKPEKDNKKGGRPPFDTLMMFKILVLQSIYNLSDDQAEYQILDRKSFQRFLELKESDKVPDSKTIWNFRETLTEKGVVEKLFNQFNETLDSLGIYANEGCIVDASFVEVPRQRNTREENKQIKSGEIPKEWKEKPNKLAQKDVDARWTQKNGVNFYGYKNHIKSDQKTKLIKKYVVTDASVHDSQPLEVLLDEKDEGQNLHGDSAYTGDKQEEVISRNRMNNQVNEKGYRGKPLSEQQKIDNKEKSRIRARVEHIFGFVENSMNGSFVRTIGMLRAKAKIGMMNLVYNIFRCIQLKKDIVMG